MNLLQALTPLLSEELSFPKIKIAVKEASGDSYVLRYRSLDLSANEISFMKITDDEHHSRKFYWNRRYSSSDFVQRCVIESITTTRKIFSMEVCISVVDNER